MTNEIIKYLQMKRFIVFLKQVPASTKVEMDPVTKRLKRNSALTQVNPDDLYALQLALTLKNKMQAEIIAVSMGPSSAEEVLREALQRGADKAILLSSRAFAGSDTLCTSRVLAAAARKIGNYSLLLFGRMAIDGDTAQVGPEVAGMLNIPQITQLVSVDDINDTEIRIRKKGNNTSQLVDIKLPCAIMVGKENGELDNLTLAGWRRAMKQQIDHWDEKELQLSPDEVGLEASPTHVVKTEVPDNKKKIIWITEAEDLMCNIQRTKK